MCLVHIVKLKPHESFTVVPGAGGALPSNGLLGMCHWMGSHFHDSTDYNEVAFSSIFNSVTRMGLHFFGTLRVRKSFAQK